MMSVAAANQIDVNVARTLVRERFEKLLDQSERKIFVNEQHLAIDRRPQFRDDAGPVISYTFGNRCDHATPVDLANVVVYGRTPDGRQIRLQPFDPLVQLKPLQLEGRFTGKEAIEYPTQQDLADVCVDIASLNHREPAQWVCLERTEARRTRGYFAEAY